MYAHVVTLLFVPTLCETNSKDVKTIYQYTAREWDRLHGAYEHSNYRIRVGSDAASWAKILELGLALDEPVGRPASSAKAQGESGGHQSSPTAGTAWKGTVPHDRSALDLRGVYQYLLLTTFPERHVSVILIVQEAKRTPSLAPYKTVTGQHSYQLRDLNQRLLKGKEETHAHEKHLSQTPKTVAIVEKITIARAYCRKQKLW